MSKAEIPAALVPVPSTDPCGESPEDRRARIRTEAVRQRVALAERLRRECAPDLAAKLEACGLPTTIICTSCGHGHRVETRCKRRWCPTCARSISVERQRRYERRLQGMKWALWFTGTIRNRYDIEVIDDLKAAWKQFRRRSIFKARTKGGLWSLEVTERGHGWHPHLHALLDCEWLAHDTPPPARGDSPAHIAEKIAYAKAELSTVWAECVGQEIGIALAVRKSGADAIRELLKYAVKGSDLLETTLPASDLIRSIDAGRTISTFGNMRNGKLPPEPDEDRPGLECQGCGGTPTWLPIEVMDMIIRKGRK